MVLLVSLSPKESKPTFTHLVLFYSELSVYQHKPMVGLSCPSVLWKLLHSGLNPFEEKNQDYEHKLDNGNFLRNRFTHSFIGVGQLFPTSVTELQPLPNELENLS